MWFDDKGTQVSPSLIAEMLKATPSLIVEELVKDPSPIVKTILESFGLEFQDYAWGELLQKVSLPAGWEIFCPGFCEWLELWDEHRRLRAEIQYDKEGKNAKLLLINAYAIRKDPDDDRLYYVVKWGNEIVITLASKNKAENWLTENFPSWRDPCAYWE